MRIAALIQPYHRPDLLDHLVDRLSSELWQIYIHLDKKSDASQFAHFIPRVRSFQSLYRVNWGSFSHVLASLHLMRLALEDQSNTHFYLMSGQCFPVKTDQQIAAILEAEAGNFISVVQMPVWHKPMHRLNRWHFHDARAIGIDNAILRKITRKIFSGLPDRNVDKMLRGMKPHAGSVWWLLNRDAVSSILRFINDNSWYLNAFRWSLIPEEMFFQTLIVNLEIRPDRASPTFDKWIDGHRHPLTIDEALLSEAKASWHLMARKFNSIID
jgi:hypothetical protein